MKEKFVVGHINPDTDSAVSALMLSRFLNKEGKDFKPVVAGKLNKETDFVFTYFSEKPPLVITEEQKINGEFFLVDHNEIAQSIASKENIIGVLDHHLLSGMKTDDTIFFRVEPLGSTSSLVYKMIKERGVTITKKEAGLLLGGIISDTLNLNSPTTTTEDIDFYHELAEISEINPNTFAEEMFKMKSDFTGKNVEDIILSDMKEYDFGGKKIGVGLVETISLTYFKENEDDIVRSVKEIKADKNFDSFFFGVVDIVNKNTWLFVPSEEEEQVAKDVFRGVKSGSYFVLEDISSRKKEIAPPLSIHYSK